MSLQNLSLSDKEIDFCNAAGISGLVLSVIVLGQHIYIMPPVTFYVVIPYLLFLYCAFSFALLIKKHPNAPRCILIANILLFLYELFLIYLFFTLGLLIFSYFLLFLLIYTTVMSALFYVDGISPKLQAHHESRKEEDDFWTNKIP